MKTERVLAEAFAGSHPVEAARIVEEASAEEAARLLGELDPPLAAAILERMSAVHGAEALARLPPAKAADVVGALGVDVAAARLRPMAPDAREPLLAALPRAVAGTLAVLLRYPPHSAGALMEPRVLALPVAMSAGDAWSRVRTGASALRHYLYVVDEGGRLVGVLRPRDLLVADPAAPLRSLMRANVARLRADADRAAIVAHPGWREFPSLPVVDERDTLLGVMRYSTLRRLEEGAVPAESAPGLVTALNIGELAWIGFAGLLAGLTTTVARPQEVKRGG